VSENGDLQQESGWWKQMVIMSNNSCSQSVWGGMGDLLVGDGKGVEEITNAYRDRCVEGMICNRTFGI
jgi:hypothetical protein